MAISTGRVIALAVTLFAACPGSWSDDLLETKAASAHDASSRLTGTASRLNDTALEKAEWVFDHTNRNHYEHVEGAAAGQIVDDNGNLASLTDCSGFMSYVIKSVARKHYEQIVRFNDGSRPRASTFTEFFAGLSPDQATQGWLGIASVRDLRPGDLIAWESPKFEATHEGNSGHVMMVLGPVGSIQEEKIGDDRIHYVSIPVIDASSVWHFAPEQLPPLAHQEHRDGVGKGSVRLVLDAREVPSGYWEGSYWGEGNKEIHKPTSTKNIHFARMVGLKESE